MWSAEVFLKNLSKNQHSVVIESEENSWKSLNEEEEEKWAALASYKVWGIIEK